MSIEALTNRVASHFIDNVKDQFPSCDGSARSPRDLSRLLEGPCAHADWSTCSGETVDWSQVKVRSMREGVNPPRGSSMQPFGLAAANEDQQRWGADWSIPEARDCCVWR